MTDEEETNDSGLPGPVTDAQRPTPVDDDPANKDLTTHDGQVYATGGL